MKKSPQPLTPEQLRHALNSPDPETVRLACDYLEAEAHRSGDKSRIADARKLRQVSTHPLYRWKPRPDQHELWDDRTSFDLDRSHRVSVCLGGTGSGKDRDRLIQERDHVIQERDDALDQLNGANVSLRMFKMGDTVFIEIPASKPPKDVARVHRLYPDAIIKLTESRARR